jgi:hypothetical protein
MTFDKFDALLLTTLFLVPGFIWSTVHGTLVKRRPPATQLRLIEFLTLSCVNHAPWTPLLGFLFSSGIASTSPACTGALLLLPTLLSPVILGFLTGRLYQRDWPRRVLGRFGFRTFHQIPTGWDYQFSRAQPYWVVVTLRDGARVFGLFGYRSFASDDPAERDLYIESVYVPHDGEWLPVKGNAGILIKADQVAAIEFRKLEEVAYGEA